MDGIPFGSFGFTVELSETGKSEGALKLGRFQEVSGLGIQVNVTDLVEGGVNDRTFKLVGNTTYPNVTLKRGLVDNAFYDWINSVRMGKVTRKDITITLLGDGRNDQGQHVGKKQYIISRALPVNWSGPALNVMQDAVATESLELAHEGLTVCNVKG